MAPKAESRDRVQRVPAQEKEITWTGVKEEGKGSITGRPLLSLSARGLERYAIRLSLNRLNGFPLRYSGLPTRASLSGALLKLLDPGRTPNDTTVPRDGVQKCGSQKVLGPRKLKQATSWSSEGLSWADTLGLPRSSGETRNISSAAKKTSSGS